MRNSTFIPKTVCLGMIIIALIANVASASVQTGDIITMVNGPGSPGGTFYMLDSSNTKVTDTFCVQIEEYIRFNHDYKVVGVSKTTLGTGSRALTSFAAWLFDRYQNGISGVGPALDGFNFLNAYGQLNMSAANIQANQLQLAIWSAMGYTPGEIGGVGSGWYSAYDDLLAGWEADFQSDVTNNVWSGTGDVWVVNLVGKDSSGQYTVNAQDQLIRIPSPDPGAVVPEPVSLAVWSVVGIMGACLIARRQRLV
jgi:hypothetical protein